MQISVVRQIKMNKSKENVKPKLFFWSIGGVVAGKKKVKLGWSTTYDSDGYQIQYAQNKKMKKAKVIKVKNGYRSTKTIKKLKKKKRYYFRIRAYKKVQGKTVYAKWSKREVQR